MMLAAVKEEAAGGIVGYTKKKERLRADWEQRTGCM